MKEKLHNYINTFKELSEEDKEIEITNHLKELIDFISNEETGDFKDTFETEIYKNKDEFLNDTFIYVLYLKELIGNKFN